LYSACGLVATRNHATNLLQLLIITG